ncbi:MAG: hypothetical protein HYR96_06495 [Deltaproteobacteria bacterium]|nr:hypothetical protein [Deltaproteobacteria bacterium]MBI3295874.1 hypothetical protein [Deltaproteobacteria bacterium]
MSILKGFLFIGALAMAVDDPSLKQVQEASRALCGDEALPLGKSYFLAGTNGYKECLVKIQRADLDKEVPSISVAIHEQKGKPVVATVPSVWEDVHVTVSGQEMSSTSRPPRSKRTESISATFVDEALGFEKLSSLHVAITESKYEKENEEESCERLKPVLTLTSEEGQALAALAERTWIERNPKATITPADTSYINACTLHGRTVLRCIFRARSAGAGNAPTVTATFAIKDRKACHALSVRFDYQR